MEGNPVSAPRKQGRVIESVDEARRIMAFDWRNKAVMFFLSTTYGGVEGQCAYSAAKELFAEDPEAMRHTFPFRAITSSLFEVLDGWHVPEVLRRCGVRWVHQQKERSNVCVVGHLPDDAIIRWEVIVNPSTVFSGESPWTGLGHGYLNAFKHRVPSTEFMVPYVEGAHLRVWAATVDPFVRVFTEGPSMLVAPLVYYENL